MTQNRDCTEEQRTIEPDLTGYTREGVIAWIRANGLEWANLASVNLRSVNLGGADLTCADLSDADLTQADVSGADFEEVDIGVANLGGADLTNLSQWGVAKFP